MDGNGQGAGAPVRAALVVAHPGHELRVHGWLERERPLVFVLTDGSGHDGASRLGSTSAILARARAEEGPIYGRLSDRQLYRAVLDGDRDLFLGLGEELVSSFIRSGVDRVAGDALEGYNPGHDICRYLIDMAVEAASRRGERAIRNYDFPLAGRPDSCPEEDRACAIRLELDDEAFLRKMASARGYPEFQMEVEAALRAGNRDLFRIECLRPVNEARSGDPPEVPPFYERHGETRVAASLYREVIRYREHVKPLAEALRRRARGG